MKINLNSDELDDLEGMSDADLAELVRGSLRKFRGKKSGADDAEDPPPDTSAAGHGGKSVSTLEKPFSQKSALERETQDAVRRAHDASVQQDARNEEMERIVPGYNRLTGHGRL